MLEIRKSARGFVAIGVLVAGALAGVTLAQQVPSTPPTPHETPRSMIDALHAAFGEHHARAVHAKGLLLEGTFTASPDAARLSRAAIFTAARTVPVTARFSDFTGIPDIPDTASEANPRGFAVKIRSTGGDVDIVTHSFNGFPVATSDEFAVFLLAIGDSGPGRPHPTPIEEFLDHHPIAKRFVTSQKPPPVSYATAAYFGVNAFKLINASGQAVFVRYRFVPRAGEHAVTPMELKGKDPNYLLDELPRRIAREAIVFDWFAQIAHNGDKADDPSVAWPEDRTLVQLGTVTMTCMSNAPDADRTTLFLPGTLHPGIEPADAMLVMRNDAYPLSFKARQ